MSALREKIRRLSPRAEFFIVLAVCFGYFIVGSTVILLRGFATYQLTTPRLVRAIVIDLAVLALVAAFLRLRRWNLDEIGLRFSFGAFLAGIPLFVMALMSYWAAYFVALVLYPPTRDLQTHRVIAAAPFPLVLGFILVNSLYEEATVTGYVITSLSEQGAALAITASTLIRFMYHLYQGPISSISILPMGLLFGAVYWRWRTLWPLMVAHTIMNLVAFSHGAR